MLTAINSSFNPYFPVHCSIFFVVCIQSSKSVIFKIYLSAIFHTIDDCLIFQEGFQLHFSMPVSLVQLHGEIGVCYGKFQVFFNSSTCCSVAAPPYPSISHNFCFTKLLPLILIKFFSGILLSYKKINDNVFIIKPYIRSITYFLITWEFA